MGVTNMKKGNQQNNFEELCRQISRQKNDFKKCKGATLLALKTQEIVMFTVAAHLRAVLN